MWLAAAAAAAQTFGSSISNHAVDHVHPKNGRDLEFIVLYEMGALSCSSIPVLASQCKILKSDSLGAAVIEWASVLVWSGATDSSVSNPLSKKWC